MEPSHRSTRIRSSSSVAPRPTSPRSSRFGSCPPHPRRVDAGACAVCERRAEVARAPKTLRRALPQAQNVPVPRRRRGRARPLRARYIVGSAESWWSDTWHTGDRVGELESISVLPEHRGAGIGSALLDAVDAEFARLGLDDQVIGVPGNVDAFVCTNGGGSDQRGSTCPGSPVATAVPRKAGYPGGARLADMGDPPEPSPEQPLGDRPTPAASPRQFVKWGVLLVITGVSLYLLLPSLLSVLSSWPSLEHLDWPFAVLVLVFEVASSICLWELDRIALGSKG